jgi:hypothetical protein
MNDITVFIYLCFFVALFGATFAFMFATMRSMLEAANKPKRNVHPEMADVRNGDELLVFHAEEEDDDDEEGDVVVVRR